MEDTGPLCDDCVGDCTLVSIYCDELFPLAGAPDICPPAVVTGVDASGLVLILSGDGADRVISGIETVQICCDDSKDLTIAATGNIVFTFADTSTLICPLTNVQLFNHLYYGPPCPVPCTDCGVLPTNDASFTEANYFGTIAALPDLFSSAAESCTWRWKYVDSGTGGTLYITVRYYFGGVNVGKWDAGVTFSAPGCPLGSSYSLPPTADLFACSGGSVIGTAILPVITNQCGLAATVTVTLS